MKKYIAIGMMVVLVFCLGGCVKIGKNSPRNKVVAYMNQKYPSDTFTYNMALGSDPYGATYKVNSVNYPNPGIYEDEYVYVVCIIDTNGQEHFSDNYMNVKYYDQTITLYEEILEEIFPGEKYTLDRSLCYSTTNADTGSDSMTFEEYISASNIAKSMHVDFEDCSFNWENVTEREAIEECILDSLIKKNATSIDVTISWLTDYGELYFSYSEILNQPTQWYLNNQKIEE